MSIVENLKNYFKLKSKGETTLKAPEGICPNCWGKQEWEGDFYKLNKGNKLVGNNQTYNNFINKIVENNIEGISIKEGDYFCVSIIDQGGGISQEKLSHVFDPFYTTKKHGHGLGLATVFSIIKNHHGTVDISSEVNVGTTLKLYLRRHPDG